MEIAAMEITLTSLLREYENLLRSEDTKAASAPAPSTTTFGWSPPPEEKPAQSGGLIWDDEESSFLDESSFCGDFSVDFSRTSSSISEYDPQDEMDSVSSDITLFSGDDLWMHLPYSEGVSQNEESSLSTHNEHSPEKPGNTSLFKGVWTDENMEWSLESDESNHEDAFAAAAAAITSSSSDDDSTEDLEFIRELHKSFMEEFRHQPYFVPPPPKCPPPPPPPAATPSPPKYRPPFKLEKPPTLECPPSPLLETAAKEFSLEPKPPAPPLLETAAVARPFKCPPPPFFETATKELPPLLSAAAPTRKRPPPAPLCLGSRCPELSSLEDTWNNDPAARAWRPFVEEAALLFADTSSIPSKKTGIHDQVEDDDAESTFSWYDDSYREGLVHFESTVDRLRVACVLLIYLVGSVACPLLSPSASTNPFTVVATSVAQWLGVFVLCYLAQVSFEDDPERLRCNGHWHKAILSRKTILLVLYVFFWNQAVDQLTTAVHKLSRHPPGRKSIEKSIHRPGIMFEQKPIWLEAINHEGKNPKKPPKREKVGQSTEREKRVPEEFRMKKEGGLQKLPEGDYRGTKEPPQNTLTTTATPEELTFFGPSDDVIRYHDNVWVGPLLVVPALAVPTKSTVSLPPSVHQSRGSNDDDSNSTKQSFADPPRRSLGRQRLLNQ